jgi:histidine triad (HIT) family protein
MSHCIFCRIVQKTVPARILHEDALCLAFEDVNPKAPSHTLIIPKKHIESLNSLDEMDDRLVGRLFLVAKKLAQEKGIAASGYRLIINTGAEAGQSVFHLHLHLLGGRPMAWPPG